MGKDACRSRPSETFQLEVHRYWKRGFDYAYFEERFEMIFKAVKEKYPEITVIGTVGPFMKVRIMKPDGSLLRA